MSDHMEYQAPLDPRIGIVVRNGRTIYYAYVGGYNEGNRVEAYRAAEVQAKLTRYDEEAR